MNKYFCLSNKTQANDSQIENESIQDFQTYNSMDKINWNWNKAN